MDRIKYIDKLKCLAIFFVVMGHIAELSMNITTTPFNYFKGTFHMPLFMFLSGKTIVRLRLRSVSKKIAVYGEVISLVAGFHRCISGEDAHHAWSLLAFQKLLSAFCIDGIHCLPPDGFFQIDSSACAQYN